VGDTSREEIALASDERDELSPVDGQVGGRTDESSMRTNETDDRAVPFCRHAWRQVRRLGRAHLRVIGGQKRVEVRHRQPHYV
jgi:hypothetical protein